MLTIVYSFWIAGDLYGVRWLDTALDRGGLTPLMECGSLVSTDTLLPLWIRRLAAARLRPIVYGASATLKADRS